MTVLYVSLLWVFVCNAHDASNQFEQYMSSFDKGYASLGIRPPHYDYREELQAIPDLTALQAQQGFFEIMLDELQEIKRSDLEEESQLQYDHLQYEIDFNLERLRLEMAFSKAVNPEIPANGLSSMPSDWYRYRVKRFTSVDITPEELFAFGQKEVLRVQNELGRIRKTLGYAQDSIGFYQILNSEAFYLTDKNEVLRRYEEIKSIVYRHLPSFLPDAGVSDIAFMEWPGADQFTPPGYYSPAGSNAYGLSVFHFNFYQQRHNARSMEWLFLHEAVPGHHYQWWMRNTLPDQPAFKRHFSYPGNFEGWAAYVEYFGKELGLYEDPFSELGKWEWDLVRSTRIMIDVGIHHYGWTKEEALACWKQHIPGQDAIAEREVIRCTNWPGQALSYKVGAWKIHQMAEAVQKADPASFSLQAFHRAYLMTGQTPLAVIEKNIGEIINNK